MAGDYEVEDVRLSTPEIKRYSYFDASIDGNWIAGGFTLVYPDRGNGDEDDSLFYMSKTSGQVWIKSIT